MSAELVLAGAVAGVGGGLVPRFAYRLSVHYGAPPRSACAGCETPFPPGRRGWVRISDRCPACRCRLGPPAWLTSLAGAVSGAALAWAIGPRPLTLAAFVGVAVLGVLLAAIDLACLRLPDAIVAAAGTASLALFGASAAIAADATPLLRGLAGAAALGGAYLLLALLPGARLGFGDVKLAAVLGLLLGWLSWGAVLLGALLPHLINGPVAVGLLLARRAGRHTELPLGPALLSGALVAVVAAAAIRR